MLPCLKVLISPLANKFYFCLSVAFLSMLYGMLALHLKWFPYHLVSTALMTGFHLFSINHMWLTPTTYQEKLIYYDAERAQPGLNKVVSAAEDGLRVDIITNTGELIHRWQLDWFDIWSDDSHVSTAMKPRSQPGTQIHGAEILDSGDLVFNFEYLALNAVDICGNIKWKLPENTHHAIDIDDAGHLWVANSLYHEQAVARIPNHQAPFVEPLLSQFTSDGEKLLEKSVFTLLQDNHLLSHLYLSSSNNLNPLVSGDTLHLNDVEIFSQSMQEGFFKHGDIMISLRNTNTVMVFDALTWKVKFKIDSYFLRQHDPDFIDGNTISVFDNQPLGLEKNHSASRILLISAPSGDVDVAFSGSEEMPFFTAVLGKHQWLANGNLLLAESLYGRLLEVTSEGQLVWEYINLVGNGLVGAVTEVERLPEKFTIAFFEDKKKQCQQ